ncbi:uncharacterized protein LOC144440198 isoform X1 [Glandiceps talaboti]
MYQQVGVVLLLVLANVNKIISADTNTVNANVGASVNLSCLAMATDDKIVTVRWGRSDDSFIAQRFVSGVDKYVEDGKYSINEAMTFLIIYDVEIPDEGVYKCTAELDKSEDNIVQHSTTLQVVVYTEKSHSEESKDQQKELFGLPFLIAIVIIVSGILAIIVVVGVLFCVVRLCRRRRGHKQGNKDSKESDGRIHKKYELVDRNLNKMEKPFTYGRKMQTM